MPKSTNAISRVLKSGFVTQEEIKSITGLSQSTISRCLSSLDFLLVLPGSSPKKYALSIDLMPYEFYEVDANGKTSRAGYVYPLSTGQYFVEIANGASKLYLGLLGNGLFDDLPYFLDDLKPQGFIGMQKVKSISRHDLGYPKNLKDWRATHVFSYLDTYGENLPGNIMFGTKWIRDMDNMLFPVERNSYHLMSEQADQGMVQNSSAGGEQQKFTAFNKETNSHVLVKYTSDSKDPISQRWQDVLVTEYHALKSLDEIGIPAAEVELITTDKQYFLETKRFDRIGNKGRSSMFSLMAIDMEFTGIGENWAEIAKELNNQKLLREDDVELIDFLWMFSKCIGNTDTHLGNISFGIDGDVFSLLPIYDMCSMAIAPSKNQIPSFEIIVPDIKNLKNCRYKNALYMTVKKFWNEVKSDSRISGEFRQSIENNQTLKHFFRK